MASLGAVSAALLVWLSVVANVHRSCTVGDTPYLPLCGAPADGAADRLVTLQRSIGTNPGDAGLYASVARLAVEPGREAALRAASTLAPNDPDVLRARAVLALEREDWAAAVPPLVQLTRYYRPVSAEVPELLARIAGSGHADLLQPHLLPGTDWFPLVLDEAVRLKAPLSGMLPLVGHASANGALPPDRLRAFVRTLKHRGQWVDAYGLWLSQHGGRVPILYNAGFDHNLQPDGFDWEVAPVTGGRAGAVAGTRPFSHRGQVLEVLYTGNSFPSPAVRQYLLLAPGRYRLAGQYMTAKLRTEGGLAWSVRCVTGAPEPPAGQSAALADTKGSWLGFDFEINVPATCGPVAGLQLETFLPYEAAAGIRGKAYFDSFSLQKLAS
ncbi:MAG: hypothetical protein Q8R69_25700 [Telluria sp.]|nr:hypothetical protein [Telluria sp.]